MAKFVVIFVLCALVAIGSAQRVAREEPKQEKSALDDLETSIDKGFDEVRNLLSNIDEKKLKDFLDSFLAQGKIFLDGAKQNIDQLNKNE